MKCEICHTNDAKAAITVTRDGAEEELYVCRECAAKERVRRQKKTMRTRKITGLPPGMSMSITEMGGEGDAPPPIIGAIMSAFHDMVSDLGKMVEDGKTDEGDGKRRKKDKYRNFPCGRVDRSYRIGSRIHLEGLHLIGELEAVRRAVRALDMRLVAIDADGIKDAGHAYSVEYDGPVERAKTVVRDLITQERNARIRLMEEMPRVFGDTLCRALAILKNCRLLSPGEFFDLLSPMRLAAIEGMLDGIDLEEIEGMLSGTDLGSGEDSLSQDDRDRVDGERADEMNRRFEDVVLNERAEEKFL